MIARATALLIALTVPATLHAQRAGSTSDSARLQGAWTMVSGSANGEPMPPEIGRTMKRVFTGDSVTVTMGTRLFMSAIVTLYPTAHPKAIDYKMTGGPTVGSTQLGIYSIKGDTLRFCFSSPGQPRPADFTSKAGDGRTVSVWVKAKP